MKAVRLRTEYLENPIGIDIKNPRLTWICENGIKQTAYRVVATSGNETVWDSGKVDTERMYAEYGEKACSRQRIEWRVSLWDENGKEGELSDKAFFEFGLLEKSDWKAKWISGDYKPNKKTRYPVDCFKKEFKAEDVVKARLYVTACGLYEVRVNGTKAGNFCLAPGYTDYNKRIQYQTYDVTGLIKEGNNILTAELADGWYRGSCGAWGLRNQYGKQTKLLVQLETESKTGDKEIIFSDGSWGSSDLFP